MDITAFRKRCLGFWTQAEGFSQANQPVEALGRARLVRREVEAALKQADAAEERRDLERLRTRAVEEVARYEAKYAAWAAEVHARRAQLEAREAASRQKPIP